MTDLMAGDDADAVAARGDRQACSRRPSASRAWSSTRTGPQWDDFQVTSVAGSPEMRDALMGATYDRARLAPGRARRALRPPRRVLHPRGRRRLERRRRALPARARQRVGPRCVASRRRALRPVPRLRRARPGRPLARRAGQRPAPVGRRARLPRRGRSLGRVCARPRPARPGGRAPPRGAGGAARRVVQARLSGLDRAGPRGGVRRRGARASGFAKVVIELIDPDDGIAAAARERRLAGGRSEPDWTVPAAAHRARCSTRRSRSAAATCSRRTTARERGAAVLRLSSRRSTAAARSRGTTTGCSSRCATAPATWSAHLGRRSRGPPAALRGAARGARACSPTRRPWRSSPPASSRSSARWPRRTRSRACPTAARSCATSSPSSSARAATGARWRSCCATWTTSSSINDTHGHPGGDRALCDGRPRACASALRAGDTAFRIGGDEFALLLPETTAEQAAIVAARIAARRTGDEPGPRLSCGIAACARATATDAETLIAHADSALYATKRAAAAMAAQRGRVAPDASLGRVGRPMTHRSPVHHRARERADRARERDRAQPVVVHPRPVAAAEQLGPLGHRLRGGRLHGPVARLARRSRHGRGGQRAPRGLRAQDRRAGRRPLRRGDRQADARSRPSSGTPSAGCWPRSSPAAACRRPRSPSTPRRSAASCRCRSPRSSPRRRCSATPPTATARSR